jgi:exodeoxyribonuclease VII large subunit
LRDEIRALRQRAERGLTSRLNADRRAVRDARTRLSRQMTQLMRVARERLDASATRLRALSPTATLSRGYAIVEAGGHILHDATSVSPGTGLRIQLHRGRLTSTVDAIEPEPDQT